MRLRIGVQVLWTFFVLIKFTTVTKMINRCGAAKVHLTLHTNAHQWLRNFFKRFRSRIFNRPLLQHKYKRQGATHKFAGTKESARMISIKRWKTSRNAFEFAHKTQWNVLNAQVYHLKRRLFRRIWSEKVIYAKPSNNSSLVAVRITFVSQHKLLVCTV